MPPGFATWAAAQMREEVVAAFRHLTENAPAVMVRSPGRINLIGDHTDYNDGFVLPAAIEHATWLAAGPRDDRVIRMLSLEEGSATISLDGLTPRSDWTDYITGTIWAMGASLEVGFDLVVGTEIPVGAGLSSSAALEVGVARIVAGLSGNEWNPLAAARAGQKAENDFVGMPCGIMDQLIVATARAGAASLIDCRTLTSTPARIPQDVVVVILDTSTRRSLVGSEYADRRAACERAAARIGVAALRDATMEMVISAELDPVDRRRAAHVVSENARTQSMAAALEAGDVVRAGVLMDESHASLRDDFAVSSDALDAMTATARSQRGCHGARVTGAGFAGCAVALVDDAELENFLGDVEVEYRSATGLQAVLYPTRPAAGAQLW